MADDDKDPTPPGVYASGAGVTTTIARQHLQVTLGGANKPTATTTGEHTIVTGQRIKYVFDQLTPDSGRMSAVLTSKTAAQPSWDFGPATTLDLMKDGGVILSQDGRPIALIEAPWAIDAAGKKLPTHYEISGSTLTQITNYPNGTVFPVVADPTWKVYPWYVRVTFNRRESLQVVGSIGGCAAALGKVPSIPTKVISAICAFIGATWGAGLTEPNTCLTIKAYPVTGTATGYLHRCA